MPPTRIAGSVRYCLSTSRSNSRHRFVLQDPRNGLHRAGHVEEYGDGAAGGVGGAVARFASASFQFGRVHQRMDSGGGAALANVVVKAERRLAGCGEVGGSAVVIGIRPKCGSHDWLLSGNGNGCGSLALLSTGTLEAIQLRGPVADVLFELAGRHDQARGEQTAAERILVERAAENRFVDFLQLPERELARQELKADGGVVELAAEALDDETEDVGMVEGEGERAAVVILWRGSGRRFRPAKELRALRACAGIASPPCD